MSIVKFEEGGLPSGRKLITFADLPYIAFIVTIVFWWLLSSGAFDNAYDIWENLSVHAANSVFAILEILFSRCILPWSGIPIIVAVCGSYIGLAYVTRATQGIYGK